MQYLAPWRIALAVLVSLFGIVFSLPNFLSREGVAALPSWLPLKQINLGLDLRGGSHLLLEVDTTALIRERLENLTDSVRSELRANNIGYTGLGVAGDAVTLRLRDAAQRENAIAILKKLASPVGGNILGLGPALPDIAIDASDGAIALRLTEQALRDRASQAVQQSIEIVRRRIDETGINEPTIQRQGANRILIQLPGVDDPERIRRLLGKTAKMVFRMVDTGADPRAEIAPVGSEILPADNELDESGRPLKYVVFKRVDVSGDHLIDAQPSFDQRTGQPVVNFRFDTQGAKRFAEITKNNVGRPFAIVLDDKVISAPVIREPILGGSGQISGNFTVQSANDLAVLLRAGALPAPLEVVEERTVGADLGADSIAIGSVATVVGFILVIVFMLTSYGLFGVFSDLALLLNTAIVIGALSALQATLTLPGIAGILLTLGMAVDANVLINERIREEARLGKTPLAAIDAGFGRAFATILDSNLTTLLAMVLLYVFGTGPVRGFAVTISIGIATSMFTAILIVRLMILQWLKLRRPARLPV
jgi:preprotein translocase subunit SecD